MSFRGRGGGGDRGRGGGASRGGGFRGGRGGGRGGFGGGAREPEGPPASVVELGEFMHPCEGELICRNTNEKIPYFNAGVFLQNKTQIGRVDEIFGATVENMFTVKCDSGVVATSFKAGDKVYVDPFKLLPLSRFTNPPPSSGGRGGGRGGGGGGRGAPRGGAGGFRGRGGAGGFRGGGGGGRGAPRGGGFSRGRGS